MITKYLKYIQLSESVVGPISILDLQVGEYIVDFHYGDDGETKCYVFYVKEVGDTYINMSSVNFINLTSNNKKIINLDFGHSLDTSDGTVFSDVMRLNKDRIIDGSGFILYRGFDRRKAKEAYFKTQKEKQFDL